MTQIYIAGNISKWASGQQNDVGFAHGAAATLATKFFSFSEFSAVENPELIDITDYEGNRSTFAQRQNGIIPYSFAFKGSIEVDKIGYFLYLLGGVISSVQDGSTGAYQHTVTFLNNIVLPPFTLFYYNGAEGYRRLQGCRMKNMTVEIGETEASFSGEGLFIDADDTPSSDSSVTTFGITDIQYQLGSLALGGSVMLATLSGAPDLSNVSNGDVFEIPTAATGISNAENKGKFIVISADNTAKTITYINHTIFDNTKDETGLTTSTDMVVTEVTAPTYATPTSILLARESCVVTTDFGVSLDTGNEEGAKNFTFTIENNSVHRFESPKSRKPLAILAASLELTATYTQIMSGINAALAIQIRESGTLDKAVRFEVEDQGKFLGTSTLYRPLLRMDSLQNLLTFERVGEHTSDALEYDVALNSAREQGLTFVLQSEIADYTV